MIYVGKPTPPGYGGPLSQKKSSELVRLTI